MNKDLLKLLIEVQKNMPIVGKDTQGFGYKYAPIETVWEAVHTIINDNGFFVNHKIDEKGVTTTAYHELGELSSFIHFSSLELKPQGKGAEITYYKRYNLVTIFNIIIAGEDKDADVTVNAKEKTQRQKNEEDFKNSLT